MSHLDGADVDVEVVDGPRRRSRLHWEGSTADLLIVALVGLLPVAYLPVFLFPTYTPRLALVLVAAVPGLVLLGRQALAVRSRSAIAAGGLALWVIVASVGSGAPLLALRGTVGRELSGLIVICAVALWAVGRSMTTRGREYVGPVLAAVLGFLAVLGILQVLLDIQDGFLTTQFGRATAFTGNPVYYGGLMAAGATLAAASSWPTRVRLPLVVLFAVAIELSGSRVAAVSALVCIVIVCWIRGGAAVERVGALGAYVAGFLGAQILLVAAPEARSSLERSTSGGSGGSGGRLQVWRYGLEAALDRPVFGWGFGRFRAATQGRFSAEFTGQYASDELRQAWFDAHNALVSTLVACGVIGVVLLLWFVVAAARESSGPLVWAAAAIGVTWSLQPAGLATLPLAALLLGVAGAARSASSEEVTAGGQALGRVGLPALALGLVLGGWLLVADLRLDAAADALDPAAAESAARMLPRDAVVADVVAQVWYLSADSAEEPAVDEALKWSQRAIDAEDDRPFMWNRLAGRSLSVGRLDRARVALDESIELQEWNVQTWGLARLVAIEADDDELEANAVSHLCEMNQRLEEC